MHAATTTGRENTRFPTQRAAQGNAGQALLSNVTFLLNANDAGTSSCRVESSTIASRSHQTLLIATERHVFCTCFSSHHCICSLCGALPFPDYRSLALVCASVTLRIRLRWLTVLDIDPTFVVLFWPTAHGAQTATTSRIRMRCIKHQVHQHAHQSRFNDTTSRYPPLEVAVSSLIVLTISSLRSTP
jgi:hypothetical protein